MAERKIISADTLPKTKTTSTTKKKPNIDLNKVKDFVVENKDTIEKVVAVAGTLIATNAAKKRSTKKATSGKSTTRKTTTKRKTAGKKDDSLSSMINLAQTLLKK